jgi:hypothetical protein
MASYTQAAQKFKHLPLELAFHTNKGHATCPSVFGRNVATLLIADLHLVGSTQICSSNHISASVTVKIPIIMDEDGCPEEDQPFPHQPTFSIV